MTTPLPAPSGDDGDRYLTVNDRVRIPRAELDFRATRSGGPGGQHVNTSSTRIELLWNPARSAALDEAQRALVAERLSGRADAEGNVRIVASDSRSQRQNRERAEERLASLVRDALVVRKKRRPTKPSRAAKEARLAEKKRRGERKRDRRGEFD
ncbi:MAG: alternative ribosome rescue aminoacyl-tRNA hydrolase ArfB [Gemmatimonadaceae bacterium]